MRLLLLAFAASFALAQNAADSKPQRLPPVATRTDTIEAFGQKWLVPVRSDWKIEGTGNDQILHLMVERPAESNPRRPTQFALADTKDWAEVTLEADVLRQGGSLILVYAFKDADHFNYAHLSTDPATKVPKAHNGIFHVFGGDRVRISSPSGPPSLTEPRRWQKVVVHYTAKTGEVKLTVDGAAHPALHAIDLSLGAGRVGLGSFFERASFRNVKISGKPAS